MERREALKKISLAMGGTLSASTFAAILTHCTSKKEYPVVQGLQFLKDDDYRIVSGIANRIIPASGTPGALDAKVPEFIDLMLFDCYSEENKTKFIRGMTAFQQHLDDDISDMENKELDEFLTEYEIEVRSEPSRKDEDFFIWTVKELTVIGYFTSEAGATQALKYIPVPGKYDACTPNEDNISWALS